MMDIMQCQMQSTGTMNEDKPQPIPVAFYLRWRLALSHQLDPRIKRYIKQSVKRFHKWQSSRKTPTMDTSKVNTGSPAISLKKGDRVRVRSMKEIQATLDSGGRLRGCKFMPEMEPYCGTVQHVFKPVQRYVNEWDYTVRKARGLVLLENNFCQGVAASGPCDRSCFYFWRVEWLEYLDKVE